MNILLAIGAGIASVASPCVLPVVPIIVTGTAEDYRHRPLLIVAGLAITFMLMGVVTSLFGSLIAGKMLYVEKAAGVIVFGMGLLILWDVNIFKKLTVFNKLGAGQKGKWSGFILGLTLGLVWIPCIGPLLSGILAMVASQGQLLGGILYLGLYALGFAIPMLLVGYSSQFMLRKIRKIQQHPLIVRVFSGGILILFGGYIFFKGILGFGW